MFSVTIPPLKLILKLKPNNTNSFPQPHCVVDRDSLSGRWNKGECLCMNGYEDK